jgi:glycosyltransferase involved in cell wall biosynthesis
MPPNSTSTATTTWNERANIENLIPTIRNTLQQIPHEIIVVDGNSSDGTFQIARLLADVAVTKSREGQTKGLLHGMHIAKYPVIVTIDADLENNPEHIPRLIQQTAKFDIVVASRTKLPRISEVVASKTIGKLLGVGWHLLQLQSIPKGNSLKIRSERRGNIRRRVSRYRQEKRTNNRRDKI